MTPDPAVDVVVAVHRDTRPIERAVGSVLDHTRAAVRVTVVAHNLEADRVRNRLGDYADDPRLRIEELHDGGRSPAGPKNRGIELATAEFVSLLDSDDVFEPGAVDAWLEAARGGKRPVDVVVAPRRSPEGRLSPWPAVRIGRRRDLDGARDRLAYRVAVHGGLIRRDRFPDLRFQGGLRTGEDQRFSAELWFTGASIAYPVEEPGYVELGDQDDRVTAEVPSVREEFAYLDALLDPARLWTRDPAARLALCVKLARMHVFDAVQNRISIWDEEVASELAEVVARILRLEPRVPRVLGAAEERLLSALWKQRDSGAELQVLLAARSGRSFAALVPRRWWLLLHGQAPLPTLLAGAVLTRRG